MMKKDQFRKVVWDYYQENGRDLPWRRRSATPYQILVSEMMLQQTQVDRVVPKYKAFIKQFPSFKALARASQKEVLLGWQGLGYNRRALNLKRTAEIVWREHNGRLPKDKEALIELPGIGPYTASAVRTFAWNLPDVVIETNIRTVYIHHFFPKESRVPDKELLPLIEKTLPKKPKGLPDGTQRVPFREWYAALMDYGTHLKKTHQNPSQKSAHHTKQSRFEGSHRQVRGLILKHLLERPKTQATLAEETKKTPASIERALGELVREGFVRKQKEQEKYVVASYQAKGIRPTPPSATPVVRPPTPKTSSDASASSHSRSSSSFFSFPLFMRIERRVSINTNTTLATTICKIANFITTFLSVSVDLSASTIRSTALIVNKECTQGEITKALSM